MNHKTKINVKCPGKALISGSFSWGQILNTNIAHHNDVQIETERTYKNSLR
jgi:hypothetical protein